MKHKARVTFLFLSWEATVLEVFAPSVAARAEASVSCVQLSGHGGVRTEDPFCWNALWQRWHASVL